MALVNGFDPSKEYVVVKGFIEGGRQYRVGDKYAPKTKIGKSKTLFRHFVAKRIKKVEDVKDTTATKQTVQEKPKTATTSTYEEGKVENQDKQDDVKNDSVGVAEEKPKTTRRRRKKTTTSED